ncbi:MAG: hypothetical protein JJU40_05590 [Rhodobacteraceae bacterium]|nr:hypothetical protein [Paracoccaceae bacterium]
MSATFTPDPARHDIVATVTHAFFCANHIREGETFVFDLKGRLDPERSSANLCLGIIARLQPALLLAQDRAAEGLHPISARYRNFDCFDTGLDHGGTGKVYVELHLVDRETGERLPAGTATL